jgi:hypothetical protein
VVRRYQVVLTRGRVIGGAALAIALVAAVVSLRGQVEPPESGPTAQPMPPTTTPRPRALPVRPAELTGQWRIYNLPTGTVAARADPEHIMLSSIAAPAGPQPPAGPRPEAMLTVWLRDGSEQEFGYRSQSADWEPAEWQILDNTLFVLEIPVDEGDSPDGGRLRRVDLVGGRIGEISVRSVRQLAPRLLTVDGELISTGISVNNPAEQCAIAIRPSTGVERTVACAVGPPIIEPADGGVLIRLPDNSPDGCAMRLLIPGRGEFGIPVFIGYCRRLHIIPLGGWRAYHFDGTDPAYSLFATDGTDRIALGTAKVAAVSCHGRLYWVSGGRSYLPYGVEVLRWTPGASEVEVVRRSRDQTESFGQPMCDKGTLSVMIRRTVAGSSWLAGLQVLDRP